MLVAARPAVENTTPVVRNSFRQPHRAGANHGQPFEGAHEAKFRKTLKAAWKGKKVTTPYEVEARVARNKTARLKELRLAKEAADKKAES